MATLVLTAAASAATASFGSGIAASLAASAITTGATLAGNYIDGVLFGGNTRLPTQYGPRLQDLSVQSSAYGRMIPMVYGSARMAGNILWARPIKETAVTSTYSSSGGKGGGGKVSQDQTSYHYSISLAIGICAGEIDGILRVWADTTLLDPNNAGAVSFRLYKGDEAQLPDSFIESFEGVGKVPAYRGMAYVVIEDFPLGEYGNRIPNFTFEVKKRAVETDAVEEKLYGMVMIPGSGEFVYDTDVQYKVPGELAGSEWAQAGERVRINQNNRSGFADSVLALDQLQETCPNVEWVSVVVGWFGTSLDAGECEVLPGVEYTGGATTEPDEWAVAGYNRGSAHAITLDGLGHPVYGGTVNDVSLVRYLQEIKSRGLNIMLYPVVFMDTEGKPWRGRLTGSVADVTDFFTKTNGYNDFILHYANLAGDYVDAFSIGSELIGLTKVKDGSNHFPAVDALADLAADVKATLGDVQVTYAADWSEYHHTEGGWYNLDPLWAVVDVVGIDAYFPLTDEVQKGITHAKIVEGWTSGEGYDWVYTDEERSIKADIDPEYAWKNIGWWWSNTHVNPDSSTTDWVPESKKIWFTEYGFPSVDGATNQPNVFYDPNSSEGHYPYHSKGRIDFRAQRMGLAATEEVWADSDMVERKFVWTWDARPFPFWPDLTRVWTDGGLWKPGHWVTGKLGLSALGAIVRDIALRAGLSEEAVDVTRLTELVDGYILNERITARSAIEALQRGYFFDAVESDGVLTFIPRGRESAVSIGEDELLPQEKQGSRELLSITRTQEVELPQRVDVVYLNQGRDYQPGTQSAQRLVGDSVNQVTLGLPIVMADVQAKHIADVGLFTAWLERNRYSFRLPIKYAALEPADVVEVSVGNAVHSIRVTHSQLGENGELRIQGVAEDVTVYDFYATPAMAGSLVESVKLAGKTSMRLLDLPTLPGDEGSNAVRIAACGLEAGWQGAVVYRADDGVSYARMTAVVTPAVMGKTVDALPVGVACVFDTVSSVTVVLLRGELESVSKLAVLNGANAAVIGGEVVQFQSAALAAPGKYTLSGFLRGRFGTEAAISGHMAGEGFVLLDGSLQKFSMSPSIIGISRDYKGVTVGSTLGVTAAEGFTYTGAGLKPLSPAHIKGVRDGSGNLTISWVRRTRISGEWRDYVDVPLAEERELYEVEILDDGDVIRMFSVEEASVEYSAAEQVADFGAAQSAVEVRVYQVSVVVGRGMFGEGVV